MNNEPVAWFYAYPDDIEDKFLCGNPELIESMKSFGKDYIITPLYTHPVKEQLTDEEIVYLAKRFEGVWNGEIDYKGFARAILRKAQEK